MTNSHTAAHQHFVIGDNVDVRISISKAMKLPWLAAAAESERSIVSTVMSELGSNIVKYADYGHMHVRLIRDEQGSHVEISAEDDGPGMADINQALQDHYTTGGTLGLGLPGVRRMSDDLRISSAPGYGTKIVASIRLGPQSAQRKRALQASPATDHLAAKPPKPKPKWNWDLGTYTRPMPGQVRGGDFAITFEAADRLLLVMLDVTGHGERAHEIGSRISYVVQRNAQLPPSELMQLLHDKLAGTVGAAAGILAIATDNGNFTYVGVGNTGIARVRGERWRGISRDGLVGSRLPRLMEQTGALASGDVILMWTDGISEVTGPRYLAQHTNVPARAVAQSLVGALGKLHDDAGCIVLRWHP